MVVPLFARCVNCGKNKTNPYLHTIEIDVKGEPFVLRVCDRCLPTFDKQTAIDFINTKTQEVFDEYEKGEK